MLISKPIFDQSGCLLCIHRSIAVSSVTAALKYDSATKFIFKFDSLDSENLLLSKWEMSQKCSIQTTADHMMSGGSLCISKLSLHILLGHQRLRYGTTAPQQLMSMLHLGVPNYLNVLVGLTVLHLFSLQVSIEIDLAKQICILQGKRVEKDESCTQPIASTA